MHETNPTQDNENYQIPINMEQKRQELALELEAAPEFTFAEGQTQELLDDEINRAADSLYGKDLMELSVATAKNLARLINKDIEAARAEGNEYTPTKERIEELEQRVDVDGHSGGSFMGVRSIARRYGMNVEGVYSELYPEQAEISVESPKETKKFRRGLGAVSSRFAEFLNRK